MVGMVVWIGCKEIREINICIKYNSNLQVIYKNMFVYFCYYTVNSGRVEFALCFFVADK